MERDDPATSPLPAECLARYRVSKLLGRGGFGEVWAAIQVGLERPVAVKVLSIAALEDAEQLDRFRNEARISAALTHPNIVRVLDHGAGDGRPWIAYELVDGPSLRDRILAGPLSIPDAIAAARDVLAALDHAHRAGILHRDIKPENVLRAASGEHKVTDFGIAKWARDGAVRTQTGVVLGTPAYLAPEQLVVGQACAASDLYSWATLFYELLVGRVPFTAAQPVMVLQQQIHEQPVAPGAHRPEVQPLLDRMIMRCLAKAPAERPEAAEVLAALAEMGAPPDLTQAEAVAEDPAGSCAPPSAGARTLRQSQIVTRRYRSSAVSAVKSTAPLAQTGPQIRRVLVAFTVIGLVLLAVVERARRGPAPPGSLVPALTGRVGAGKPVSASTPSPAARAPQLVVLAERMDDLLAGERKRWPSLHDYDSAEMHLREVRAARAELERIAGACDALAGQLPAPAVQQLSTRIAAYRFVLWTEVARLLVPVKYGLFVEPRDWMIYDAEGARLLEQFLPRAAAVLAVDSAAPDAAFFEALEDTDIVARCFSVGAIIPAAQPDYERVVKAFLDQISRNRVVARYLGEAFGRHLKTLGGTKAGLQASRAALEAKWPGARTVLRGVVAAVTGPAPSPRR